MTEIKEAPQAKDFMNRHVQTVGPDATLRDIVDVLLTHGISNVPVVELNEKEQPLLIGFVSEADCLEYLSNEMFYGSPMPPQTARTIMKKHPVCVEPNTDIFTLASIFVSHRLRHLPVVDNQKLLGIVSRRDILKSLDGYYQDWTESSEREKTPLNLHEIIHHRFLVSGR